ncbi:MAG TPA: hypothetical protein VJM31_18150 [Vicinamibacterales bacterium]|nr:hypothetical protein [Vicinamibacterales bacterium]
MNVRRAFAVFGALTLTVALTAGSYAQDKNQEQAQEQRKLSNDERREYLALNELVDAVAAGKQSAPADVKLKFQNHFLKSNDKVYIPYILEVSGGTFTSFPVAMYIRAVKKDAAAAPAPKPDDKPIDWPFADVYFLNEKNVTTTGGVTEVPRALALPSGEYTLYIALRERQPKDKKQGSPKTVVLAQPLTVPDMNKGLTTSSVILAKALDPAPEQLTGQQQLEQPYTISGYRVTPTFSQVMPQTGALLFVFFIYNEGVAASGKPDMDLEYNFFRAAEDKPFTKLAPQSFNATTLPGQFDVKLGHQVFVGQEIPLKNEAVTFAPGEYRLELKITDKINSQTITRIVPFTVS